VVFEPTISADERPQTYALDRAATGTGKGFQIQAGYAAGEKSATDCPKPYHWGENFIRQYIVVLRYKELYLFLLFSMGVKLGLLQ